MLFWNALFLTEEPLISLQGTWFESYQLVNSTQDIMVHTNTPLPHFIFRPQHKTLKNTTSDSCILGFSRIAKKNFPHGCPVSIDYWLRHIDPLERFLFKILQISILPCKKSHWNKPINFGEPVKLITFFLYDIIYTCWSTPPPPFSHQHTCTFSQFPRIIIWKTLITTLKLSGWLYTVLRSCFKPWWPKSKPPEAKTIFHVKNFY